MKLIPIDTAGLPFRTSLGETTKPFQVRASCGHIVTRRMRESTAGIPYTPDVVLDAPNGRACDGCEEVAAAEFERRLP